jgi:hypothetical protein
MVVSNEPEYYKNGNLGVFWVVNLLEIQYVKPKHNEEPKEREEESGLTEKEFFNFAKLRMIPIKNNLNDYNLITEAKVGWLDTCHGEVFA